MEQSKTNKINPEKLVTYILEKILKNPDSFKLSATEEAGLTKIEVNLAKEDIGKIIGKGGSTIWAIRRLASIAGANLGKKVLVNLVE